MENDQLLKGQDPDPKDLSKKPITNQEAAEFENPSTDPGFEPSFLEEEPDAEDEQQNENELPDEEDDDVRNEII